MKAIIVAISVGIYIFAQLLLPVLGKKAPIRFGDVGEGGVLVKPSVLKVLALGFDNLLADMYYMKSLQYFGDKDTKREPMLHMYSLINAAVTLDPKFDFAYRFGWSSLTTYDPRGDHNPEVLSQADDLISRGVKNCPDSFRANLDYAFHLFFYMNDYNNAAEYLERTYELTKVELYALLAARLRAKAGTPEFAIQFLKKYLEGEEDPKKREKFEKRILELTGQISIIKIEKAANRFKVEYGRYPDNIKELIKSGYITNIDREPFGGEFAFDPKTGKASSTVFGRLEPYKEVKKK